MIDRRRAPSEQPSAETNPASSGPRYSISSVIRRSTDSGNGGVLAPSSRIAPAMPHMSANLLGSENGRERAQMASQQLGSGERGDRVGQMPEGDAGRFGQHRAAGRVLAGVADTVDRLQGDQLLARMRR